MNALKEIKTQKLEELFLAGTFGLEKEGLRATLPATLSRTDHPKSLGNPERHPYITTDYSEAMPEIVTPPLTPYSRAHDYLQILNYILLDNLEENEYIWPFSVPCQTPKNEEEIRIARTTNSELKAYRLYTGAKYSKKRQLINGIHINYSFNPEFLEKLFEVQEEFPTLEKFRDEFSLKLASNFIRYQWFIVYLFGASPVAEGNFFESPFLKGKKLPTAPMRSLRNSHYGFINRPEIGVRYDSIRHYTEDLTKAVKSKILREEREFYGDIRLRGVTKASSSLLQEGIQYIEIRSFDNNPYHPVGINKETLQFIHLFFLTMVTLPHKVSAQETEEGKRLKKIVAEEDPLSKTSQYEEGQWLINEMKRVIEYLMLDEKYRNLVDRAADLLEAPEKTIAGKIVTDMQSGVDLLALGERLGWAHKINVTTSKESSVFESLSSIDKEEIIKKSQQGLDISLGLIEKIS